MRILILFYLLLISSSLYAQNNTETSEQRITRLETEMQMLSSKLDLILNKLDDSNKKDTSKLNKSIDTSQLNNFQEGLLLSIYDYNAPKELPTKPTGMNYGTMVDKHLPDLSYDRTDHDEMLKNYTDSVQGRTIGYLWEGFFHADDIGQYLFEIDLDAIGTDSSGRSNNVKACYYNLLIDDKLVLENKGFSALHHGIYRTTGTGLNFTLPILGKTSYRPGLKLAKVDSFTFNQPGFYPIKIWLACLKGDTSLGHFHSAVKSKIKIKTPFDRALRLVNKDELLYRP